MVTRLKNNFYLPKRNAKNSTNFNCSNRLYLISMLSVQVYTVCLKNSWTKLNENTDSKINKFIRINLLYWTIIFLHARCSADTDFQTLWQNNFMGSLLIARYKPFGSTECHHKSDFSFTTRETEIIFYLEIENNLLKPNRMSKAEWIR